MQQPQDKFNDQLRNYRDVEGLSTRRLDFGLWYIRNRKKFFIALVIILALTAAGTIGYSLWQFSSYLIFGIPQDKQNYLDLTSSTSLITNKVNLGSNISYSEARVLAGHDGKYDVVAAVTNANARLSVALSYAFEVNGQKIGATQDFVLPGDTKYLMALSQDIPGGSTANLIIEQTNFIRLDRHKIADWEQYRSERLNFVIENAKFTPSFESGLSEKISLGQLDFKVTNNSAYGYKVVPLAILLKSQGSIVAVNRYIINNFRSGEEKTVQLSWPGRLPNVNEVEILPDINIVDDNVYLKYSSL
jgi:hypothetical protein